MVLLVPLHNHHMDEPQACARQGLLHMLQPTASTPHWRAGWPTEMVLESSGQMSRTRACSRSSYVALVDTDHPTPLACSAYIVVLGFDDTDPIIHQSFRTTVARPRPILSKPLYPVQFPSRSSLTEPPKYQHVHLSHTIPNPKTILHTCVLVLCPLTGIPIACLLPLYAPISLKRLMLS